MVQPQHDEIELVGILLFLRRNLLFMAAMIAAALVIGIVYIVVTPSEFYSQSVFMLKKGDDAKDNSGLLSRLGGMGQNMAALGIGVSGSSLQDRAEFILRSRELAETVIQAKGLLPRLFSDRWDAKGGRWKEGAPVPSLKMGVAVLTGAQNVGVKKGFFTVGFMVKGEPELARDLVEAYLEALNHKIQMDAKNESEENRNYLEQALRNTPDPTVQEKIQNRIAFEIEKFMLVSSNSLDILERPIVPDLKSKPSKRLALVLSLMSGLIAAIALAAVKEAARNLGSKYAQRARA